MAPFFSVKQYKLAWTWHWPGYDLLLNVSDQAAAVFDKHRQIGKNLHERGGQLFFDLSRPEGVWLLATPPHPADKASATWLEMNRKRCESEIEAANAHGLRLVGTWHTHPENYPSPSPQDISTLRAFSQRYRNELPRPIAIIVGRAQDHEGIRAWSFRPPLSMARAHIIKVRPSSGVSAGADEGALSQ